MKPPAHSKPARLASFTLVEILVAMAVLSIMILGLGTMMAFVTRAWVNAMSSVDNFTKARTMLTLQDRDVQQMVFRPDVAAFYSNATTPAFAFYTKVAANEGVATSDYRAMSLVQYYITTNAVTTTPKVPAYTLVRQGYGIGFPTNAGGALPNSPPWQTTIDSTHNMWYTSLGVTNALTQLANLTAPATQSENLATGVVAFQWQFINGNGTILTPPTYLFSFNFLTPSLSSNPRILVVSMVVLSNSAYAVAAQTGTLPTVAADFPTNLPTSATNQTFSQYWNSIYNSSYGTNFGTGLPEPVRHGILIFERHIPLPFIIPTSS